MSWCWTASTVRSSAAIDQVEAVEGASLELLELLAIVEPDLVRGHQPTFPVT